MNKFDIQKENREILREYRKLLKSYHSGKEIISKKEDLIRRAFELAMEAHKNTRRKSGEPYILHPLAVAQIAVEEIGLGSRSIACALLHDVVEDTFVTLEDIDREFGEPITTIIDGLTKISEIIDGSGSVKAENIKKILLTLAKDVRIILIKLADRLHNMRTLEHMSREKQIKIASETSYLYVPLAHRLGLYNIKSELEDLCMKHTQPEIYRDIAKKLNETKRSRTRYVNEFIKPIKEELEKRNFNFEIMGRPKTISSIWNKINTKNVTFEEVYDKFAVRIIIDCAYEEEKRRCWEVYAILTNFYRPNPDRLRDWISTPKGNGYESLHTTIMGPKGQWVEVQIRSRRMNDISERGYAAHWKYKNSVDHIDSTLDFWLDNVRNLLENPGSNTYNFLDNVKLDLFSDEMYIFTPKGDYKILPTDATVLDFAYSIHTEIGHKCIGAKANHKIVTPSHVLKNGDQVEILLSKKRALKRQSLHFVITAKAKQKINDALNREYRNQVSEGKKILERYFRKIKADFSDENISRLFNYYEYLNANELYHSITTKRIDQKKLDRIKVENGKLLTRKRRKPTSPSEQLKEKLLSNSRSLTFGEEKIDYSLAKCCSPIPGEDIVGFRNKFNVIEIHEINCKKAVNILSKYDYEVVKSKWTNEQKIAFLTGIILTGLDDIGVVQKIVNIISVKNKLNMQSLTLKEKDGMFEGHIRLFVNDIKHLERIIKKLEALDGILSVNRMGHEMLNQN